MQNKILIGLATVFVAILAWVWQTNYAKLVEIDTNLQEVKTQLAVMQANSMTDEHVRKIIAQEFLMRGIK